MTPRERAYKVAREWMPDSAPDSAKLIALMVFIERAIADAAREAVQRERAGCLGIVDKHICSGEYGFTAIAEDIYEVIRARNGGGE